MSQIGQQVLFPLRRKAVWVQPAGLGTADCSSICRCDDSCEYAIKDQSKNNLIPHSEWLCTKLADIVGIAGPTCQIIEMLDGSCAFGSRWSDGALPSQPSPSKQPWWYLVQTNAIPIASISTALSRIYAFDHFVHNIDRHAGNFLVLPQRNGHAVLAFDYSRAWACNGFPLPPLPFADPNCGTIRLQRQLRGLYGDYINKAEARKLLEMLAQVPTSHLEKIIGEQPDGWLDEPTKNAILSWWSSSGMPARADQISLGIENGTYL